MCDSWTELFAHFSANIFFGMFVQPFRFQPPPSQPNEYQHGQHTNRGIGFQRQNNGPAGYHGAAIYNMPSHGYMDQDEFTPPYQVIFISTKLLANDWKFSGFIQDFNHKRSYGAWISANKHSVDWILGGISVHLFWSCDCFWKCQRICSYWA